MLRVPLTITEAMKSVLDDLAGRIPNAKTPIRESSSRNPSSPDVVERLCRRALSRSLPAFHFANYFHPWLNP
jgi:hypothetical protein